MSEHLRGAKLRAALWQRDEYRAWMLAGEARAILACRPRSKRLLNACCVIRGYAELFPHYEAHRFPWEHLKAIVHEMRFHVEH